MADKWAYPKAMWDERFSQAQPVYGEHPNAYLKAQVFRLKPNVKVFVPADGYGRNGIWLAKQGFQVHTADLSPVGVERARRAAEAVGAKMTQEVADLASWNWPVEEFDAVASIFFHMTSEVRGKIHAAMVRALKPGGMIIFQSFTPQQLQYTSGGPKQVDMLCTAETLKTEFAGAEPLELEEKVVDLNEGHMHSGPGAVVQGVFRKL